MYGIIFNGMTSEDLIRQPGGFRLATYLRRLGWDIEVVDYLTMWEVADLMDFIKIRNQQKPILWIGFGTTYCYRHNNVRMLINFVKENFPHIKILAGGNAPMKIDIGADYYIYGFGERATEAVLRYEFSNGEVPISKPLFDGVFIDALTNYPAWPLDDYINEYQDVDFIEPTDVLGMEFGRGCRFKCKFCNFPVLGLKEDTSMSEEAIYSYLQTMYDKWGVTSYSVADETINERTSKLEKISNAVQRCSFDPNFAAFTRIDLFNRYPEQVELLAGARVWSQFYGIETLNHQSGKIIGKGLDPEIIKKLMLDTKNYFKKYLGLYRGTASLISGLPYETEETLENTYNWLLQNWLDEHWIFQNLSIYKGDDMRLSAFGEDFSLFGYSELTEEEIQNVPEIFLKYNNSVGNNKRGGGSIMWKNENGNIFTFGELAEKFDGEKAGCEEGNYCVFENLTKGLDLEAAINTILDPVTDRKLVLKRQLRYIENKKNTL